MGGCCCRTCPFLLEGCGLTKPCVTAGRGGRAPPPLSDGACQPPAAGCSHIPMSCILLTNTPRQFKQGRCMGDARQSRAGRGAQLGAITRPGTWAMPAGGTHGPAAYRRDAPARIRAASPGDSPPPAPGPAGAGPVGIPAWCQAALCYEVISVFALEINANCRGFIDQLGEVLPVFSGETLNANRAEI